MAHPASRKHVNDESRNTARQHGAAWSDGEVEFLTVLWDGTEETLREIAEELGRTVEACRQKYYYPECSERPRSAIGAGRVVSLWAVGFCASCSACTDVRAVGSRLVCVDCAP